MCRFLEEEGPRLDEASEKCSVMMKTLMTLLQVASVQSRRTPHIPYYHTVSDPDRSELMENIMAIIPNHTHRLGSLAAAEEMWEKKQVLHSENKAKIKEFESILKSKKEQLHRTVPSKDLDTRREMKLKALYMEDRFRHGGMKVSVEGKKLPGILKKAGGSRERGKEAVAGSWVSSGGGGGKVLSGDSVGNVELLGEMASVEKQRASRGQEILDEEGGRGRSQESEGEWREASREALRSGEGRGNGGAGRREARSQEREIKDMEVGKRGIRGVRSQETFLDEEGGGGGGRREVREARSQEMLLGGVRKGRSQEAFPYGDWEGRQATIEERWAERRDKPLLTKEDLFRQGWGRGVASQEVGHSQESQHSLPPKLERLRGGDRGGSQDTTEMPYSHSQPEYYPPLASTAKHQSASTFSMTPPTKPRHSRPRPMDFEEGKRKSIGDVGDLIKVEKYYDTLERKKHATSSKESSPSIASSRGVAKQKWGGAYEESVPPTSSYLNSSYSGSSVVSTSTGSGVVARQSGLKSSSLLTTSSSNSFSGVEATSSQAFTSSGSSGGLKISPLRNSHVAADTSEGKLSVREKRSSIPRSQKAKSIPSHSALISGSRTDKVAPMTKRPHIEGFPLRYSMVDYRSSKSETPSPPGATNAGSPSRSSKRGKRSTLTKAPSGSFEDTSEDLRNGNRTATSGVTKLEPRSKHVVVSHSDAPFHSEVAHSNAPIPWWLL